MKQAILEELLAIKSGLDSLLEANKYADELEKLERD